MPGHAATDDSESNSGRQTLVHRDFAELVRDALKNLHDVSALQTHALLRFIPPEERAGSVQAGRALTRSLREAIEALHDEPSPPGRAEGERR
ncbi:MAG: hypothetical protein ACRDIY_20565, partial [Chloroflexota bacterium]